MTATSLHTDDPVLGDFAELIGTDDPVAVKGGGTRWELGGSIDAAARLVDAPAGIVEYRPEEMTVCVRTGTSVAELHATLAEAGQRTALPERTSTDPARHATVGGALVVGESDVRALGRGLVRTSLLQVRYVSAEGRLISSGGPTVKNVSGFDLPRLMVGSLGTLGLLAEVILRTNPVPEVSRWLHSDDADPALVHRTALHPSAVLWDGTQVWVELEGHERDVEAQTRALADIGAFTEVDAAPEPVGHRWSLSPAEVLTLDTGDGDFLAAVGLGLAWRTSPQPPRPVPHAVRVVSERLKTNFDPTGRLNPGRDVLSAAS